MVASDNLLAASTISSTPSTYIYPNVTPSFLDMNDTTTTINTSFDQTSVFDYSSTSYYEDIWEENPAEFWVPVIIFGLIFAIGIPGNALVLYILLFSRNARTVTNMYLVNLSLVDLIFLSVEAPVKMKAYILVHDHVDPGGTSIILCKISVFLIYVNLSVSITTLAALAINRYCAVMHPVSTRIQR
ncbi:tachykinin-like peptides receptor 86C [Strongylocentrotus purpuratus]|uniref:G-protein coupled receptors family 1 profile domain-containing protein n=1 Tax=Strongylocentrotus purpuratus TaxID=7668 RepID=A0A7M7LLM3_STRPU|nr:tachykinin-like peptides receptor 86C [Strongylocentrotus purpuratus]|eukprot:XP_003729800.1 PREDICTED: tachykinin-like peptides receptor 86C [Strongylocentrotus purpuratus]